MQTSYFNNVKNNTQVVSIAVSQPKYLSNVNVFSLLAPRYKLLSDFRKELISQDDYVCEYNYYLSKLDPQIVWDSLHEFSSDPIICCHCSVKYFCHRHLVAEWFEENLDVVIPEYNVKNVVRLNGNLKPKESDQFNLF